jgi:hypothetical protein
MVGIRFKGCSYCPSIKVYRSEPGTWLQRASVLFLLRVVRCHVCAPALPCDLLAYTELATIRQEIRPNYQRRKSAALGIGTKRQRVEFPVRQAAYKYPVEPNPSRRSYRLWPSRTEDAPA